MQSFCFAVIDDKSACMRTHSELQPAFETGFIQHIGDMCLDTALGNAELCRNFCRHIDIGHKIMQKRKVHEIGTVYAAEDQIGKNEHEPADKLLLYARHVMRCLSV